MLALLISLATLSIAQTQPGSIADQASRPLWMVAATDSLMLAVDVPPARSAGDGPIEFSLWAFIPVPDDGMDRMAAAVTVDCSSRTILVRSLAGYLGPNFVTASVSGSTTPEQATPGTNYGAVVAYVCDPHDGELPPPDFATFRDVSARPD